jgi:hypothetical protein
MDRIQIGDEQIAAMSVEDRRALIMRLTRANSTITSVPRMRRKRRRRLALILAAPVVLLPWVIYLAVSLPDHYVARNWVATWVGFDVLLMVMFALTAIFSLLRRQLLVLFAYGTGVLLVCDAWFDVMTATPSDRWLSLATALLAELPIAALLISGALRLVRMSAMRFWVIEPGQPLWTIPLPLGEPVSEHS